MVAMARWLQHIVLDGGDDRKEEETGKEEEKRKGRRTRRNKYVVKYLPGDR